MSLKSNLPRWIHASLQKHFDSKKSGYELFMEGQIRDTQELENYFELRINGPLIEEKTRDEFQVFVMVDVLCVSKINEQDFFRLHNLTGIMSEAMEKCIDVFKYGNGNEDTKEKAFCLQLMDNPNGTQIEIDYYGKQEDKAAPLEASVQAGYWGSV